MPQPRRALWLLLALFVGLPSPAPTADCTVLEDFSKSKVGDFPADWKPRKESGRPAYTVAEEGPLRFLRAVAKGLGIQAARQREWDLHEYPVLAWRWRAMAFPPKSDERESKTNDSAVAVYVAFPHSPVSVRSLKYVWSRVVPVGTLLESSAGLTKVRILRTDGDVGEWHEEQVNVLEDFRRRFGEKDAPKAAGIGVLTDADDTRSEAKGDYADFRLCRP